MTLKKKISPISGRTLKIGHLRLFDARVMGIVGTPAMVHHDKFQTKFE